VLIVLAVVLALLVLLCAGVISFLLKQGNTGALAAAGRGFSAVSEGSGSAPAGVASAGVVDTGSSAASYRLIKQAAGTHSLNSASEGRQTL